MIGITVVLPFMEYPLCGWHYAHCPEPPTFVMLQAALLLIASVQSGKLRLVGVSHSLKLRLMNGTQVCLAPGLECGFVGLGV